MIDNWCITAAAIRANERLLYTNDITYIQAYYTIQALLVEIDSDKADCFAKFSVYIERYLAVYPCYYTNLKLLPNRNFEAVFFAPAGYKRACAQIRPILAVDSIYTRSKYRIQLLIAVGIDANNNRVPVY
jgi:hypothetical protein